MGRVESPALDVSCADRPDQGDFFTSGTFVVENRWLVSVLLPLDAPWQPKQPGGLFCRYVSMVVLASSTEPASAGSLPLAGMEPSFDHTAPTWK